MVYFTEFGTVWHCFDTVWHLFGPHLTFLGLVYLIFKVFSGSRRLNPEVARCPSQGPRYREGPAGYRPGPKGGIWGRPGHRLYVYFTWVGPWQYHGYTHPVLPHHPRVHPSPRPYPACCTWDVLTASAQRLRLSVKMTFSG